MDILFFVLFVAYISISNTTLLSVYGSEVNIAPGKASLVNIIPNETTSLEVSHLDSSTYFIIIQIHTQKSFIKLSSSSDFTDSTTITGASAGMISMVTPGSNASVWYVTVNNTKEVKAMVFISLYTRQDPVPGACNQVFKLKFDPHIELTFAEHWTWVWFQWANLANIKTGAFPDCENHTIYNSLEYKVFVNYLQENSLDSSNFFTSLQQMLTPDDITTNAIQIYSVKDSPNSVSRVKVMSSPNQGAIYSVVVTQLDTGRRAAYVPSVTYACSWGDCSTRSDALEIVLAIALGCVGAFLLLFGHRFFLTSQSVFAFCFFGVLAYIVFSTSLSISETVKLASAGSVGLAGVGFWLGVWHLGQLPIINVFLVGLCSGWLVSATIFFTPFGNIIWWTKDENYAVAFTAIGLLFAVSCMAYSKPLNILSCGIVGSYLLLMSAAIPLHSSLRLIFLFAIFRQTESGLQDAKISAPLNVEDILLMSAWPSLAVMGILFQTWREWGRPAFPDNHSQRRTARTQYLVEENQIQTGNERQSLITNSVHQSYQSTQGASPNDDRLITSSSSSNPIINNDIAAYLSADPTDEKSPLI